MDDRLFPDTPAPKIGTPRARRAAAAPDLAQPSSSPAPELPPGLRPDPAEAGAPASNIPEYSVSEISGAVKQTLEGRFGRIRVRGEITEFKRYPSGHLYFSLKDEGGKISAVVWRGSASRLGLAPENGIEVVATGKISAYGERSSYQLIVDRMEFAGAGALLAKIEMLRQRLGAEGLFDPERKRALPRLPALIGLVTSPQGAVLHDIRTTVARRFPRHLLLWPVPVQGEGAAARIAAAIRGFDALPETGSGTGAVRRPDVLIVARGGGSLEDLMAFNDEAVLRAVADCRIPLISAVGHETDTTLIDYVSDRRAPTPTAAAELAVPARLELLADLAHQAARLASGLQRHTQAMRLRLGRAAAALPDLPGIVGGIRQRLDDRGHRLDLALPNLLGARRTQLIAAERHMPSPHGLIEARRGRVRLGRSQLDRALPSLVAGRRAQLVAAERHMPAPRALIAAQASRVLLAGTGLAAALRASLRERQHRAASRPLSAAPLAAALRERRARLEGLGARLETASHQAALARGYALVQDAEGRTVTRAASQSAGARLSIVFGDGALPVRVEPAGPRSVQGALDL